MPGPPARPGEADLIYRGVVAAGRGLIALITAARPGVAGSRDGLARIIAALEARGDSTALARPRPTREPVLAILTELYPAQGDETALMDSWSADHTRLWDRLRTIIVARLLHPSTRTAPDDPSTAHLARYPRPLAILRGAWRDADLAAIEQWLPAPPGAGAIRNTEAEKRFVEFMRQIRAAHGRDVPSRPNGRVFPEMDRLTFPIYGRVDRPREGVVPARDLDPTAPERLPASAPEGARRAGTLPGPRASTPDRAVPTGGVDAAAVPPPGDAIEETSEGAILSRMGEGDVGVPEAIHIPTPDALETSPPEATVPVPYRQLQRDRPESFVLPAVPRPEAPRERPRPIEAGGEQTLADMARCDDQPLISHHRALPDDNIVVLFDALLDDGPFPDWSLLAQSMLLTGLCGFALHIRPRRLVGLTVTQARPGPRDADCCFDEVSGLLWVRPEEPLVDRLAADSSHEAHEPVVGPHWPLLPPAPLGALLRLHLRAARAHFPGERLPSRHALWAAERDVVPRPLAYTDIVDFLRALSRGRSLTILPDDLLRVGEALAWRTTSRICPGAVPWITGTYSPRLRVVSSYQALRADERADTARQLLDALVAEIAVRPSGWPGDGPGGASVAARLARLLAIGEQEAAIAPTDLDPSARCGTPRLLSLDHIAREYVRARQSAWPLAVATPTALGRFAAVCLRVLLGLRRTELRLLRRADVIGLATREPSLIVQGKPGGDGRVRPLEIPLCGEVARVLRAYVERVPTRDDGKLLDPALLTDVLDALPHGVRAALASYAVSRYLARPTDNRAQGEAGGWYPWTPRDWLIVHALMGHEIAGLPVGQDDEATRAEMRRTMASLNMALHDELIARGAPDTAPTLASPSANGPAAPDPSSDGTPDAPPSSRLARLFLARPEVGGGGRSREAVARFLTGRLDRTAWPTDEAALLRRLAGWYDEAIIVEGDRRGRESWRLVTALGETLVAVGALAAPPLLPRRGLRDVIGPTLDLVGLADPAGTQLRAGLRAELVGQCAEGTARGRAGLAPVAGLLLLLDCGWPDALVAISRARWSDLRLRESILRLPAADDLDGDDPDRDRAITLGPDTEFALIALHRHIGPDDAYLLRAPGTAATTPAAIADMLRREWRRRTGFNASPRLTAAIASRQQREWHGGLTVAIGVEGRPARPLQDWRTGPLDAHVAAGFSPVTTTDLTPLAHRRPRVAGWDADDDWLTALGREVRRQLMLPDRGREDLAMWLRGRAAALLPGTASDDGTWLDPSSVARAMAAAADGEEALRANAACALRALAARIVEGKRDRRGRARAAAPSLAPNTIDAYWDDHLVALRQIGTTPLHRWAAPQWAILEARETQPDTTRRLLVTLRQLRDAARADGIPALPGWTLAAPTASKPLALLTPAQIEGLVRRLRRDGGELADDLCRLFGIQLRHGLRLREATALLARDILATACWVDAGHTKDGEGRLVASNVAFADFEAELREHLRTTRSVVREGDPEPPFIAALVDPGRLAEIERRYRAILAEGNVWPHLLRHQYGTVRVVAARTARAEPTRAWPQWVIAAAQALDPVRELAANYGHTTTTYTAGTYDQGVHWRLRREAARHHEALRAWPVTRRGLGALLRLGGPHLDAILARRAGARSDEGTLTLAAALVVARSLVVT